MVWLGSFWDYYRLILAIGTFIADFNWRSHEGMFLPLPLVPDNGRGNISLNPLQVEHIRECARVASKIFLTTPNRWHWLEFHTKFPLIHWLPKSWHRFLLNIVGLSFWAKEDNLNLLGRAELLNLAKQALGDNFSIRVETIWALGMPSNLVLLARRIND